MSVRNDSARNGARPIESAREDFAERGFGATLTNSRGAPARPAGISRTSKTDRPPLPAPAPPVEALQAITKAGRR